MCGDLYTNPDILIDELTDHKIDLVQASWDQVLELGEETVGQVIFKNLFEADSELVELFGFSKLPDFEDSAEYATHITTVVKTVDTAVKNLKDFESIIPTLNSLGSSHIQRGVTKKDYETLGGAILTSLKQALGKNFTFEVKRAW